MPPAFHSDTPARFGPKPTRARALIGRFVARTLNGSSDADLASCACLLLGFWRLLAFALAARLAASGSSLVFLYTLCERFLVQGSGALEMACAPPPRFPLDKRAATPSEAGGAGYSMLFQMRASSIPYSGPTVCGCVMACATLAQMGALDLGRMETQTLRLRAIPERGARAGRLERSCSLGYLFSEALARLLLTRSGLKQNSFSSMVYNDPRLGSPGFERAEAICEGPDNFKRALGALGVALLANPAFAGTWWQGSEPQTPAKRVALTDAWLGLGRFESWKMAQSAHMACFGPMLPIRRRALAPGETEEDLLRSWERSETPFLRMSTADALLALWPEAADFERACGGPSALIERLLMGARPTGSQLFRHGWSATLLIQRVVAQFGVQTALAPLERLLAARGGYGVAVINKLAGDLRFGNGFTQQNPAGAQAVEQLPRRARCAREALCLANAAGETGPSDRPASWRL